MASTFPFRPPTTNTLNPEERKQLLKSAHKVGALLGSTPRVLESASVLSPSFTPPGARGFLQEGRVFHNQSASSSQTSLSSCDAGESFLWIPSPSEKPSKQHHRSPSSPISIQLPQVKRDTGVLLSKTGHKKSKSSPHHNRHHRIGPTTLQQLPQPYLYRLRSVPSPTPIISVPPSYKTDEKITTPGFSSPLSSPAIQTASSSSMSTLESSDSSGSPKKTELSDSDRRRKMAKLARTFGEKIPPELVFGQSPPRNGSFTSKSGATTTSTSTSPATTATSTAAVVSHSSISRRTRSKSNAQHRSGESPRSRKDARPPVLALTLPKESHADDDTTRDESLTSPKLPPQSPIVIVTTITTDASGKTTTPKRKHRPRSLTLSHIPMGQQKGIVLLQDEARLATRIGRKPSRSLDESERTIGGITRNKKNDTTHVYNSTTNLVDYGYRKEREWSGEWNVKDMEQVMHSLRHLRVR